MRLVFMGTPEFGIPTLCRLFESRHDVVGVVTRPDRPKGRGLKTSGSVVKQQALRFNLPVLQPENLRDTGFMRSLKDYHADCFVVVGFRIMPVELFTLPPNGAINLHASLLPKYRGAAPIQWALIHGEKETGVSVFFIEEKVDTGQLILQKKVPIEDSDDAGVLHDKLADVGSMAVLHALDLIENGKVKPNPQRGTPTPAPKILPQHCRIQWDQHPSQIINLIRGLSPTPGAFTLLNGKRLKVFKANIVNGDLKTNGKPGEILEVQKEGLVVAAKKGKVKILELQIEGKRRMQVDAFIRGYPISAGMVFGYQS